jgi:quinohemoprotein amine dehydrogenase beta subunit
MSYKNLIKNLLLGALVTSSNFISLSADTIELEHNKEYIVTETRPGYIVLADVEKKKVINSCKIVEAVSPAGIILAPNNKFAFIVGGYGEEIGGYDITNCNRIFHANLSKGYLKGQTLAGIAISNDSKQVYVAYNRTTIGPDRYTVLDPMFSTFNVADGLDAQAVSSFKIPRQITLISVAKDGSVYGVGSHLYKIDAETGVIRIAKKIHGWGRKGVSEPDSFANYIIGQQQNDFSTLYAIEKYADGKTPSDDNDWLWGMTSVDLKTGEITQMDIGPADTSLFSIMRDPTNRNIAYGCLNQLAKFDIKKKKEIKNVTLDHTYYTATVSLDGKKVYLGNSLDDIAIYSSDLEKLGNIQLPGDMGSAALQVFRTK